MTLRLFVLGAGLVGLVAAGCGKPAGSAQPAPAPTPPPTAGGATAGRAVYEAHNCARCHTISGEGKGKGPDLTRVGASRDKEWLIAQVKDAKSHKGDSKMPAFAGKITEAELSALGDYLASLK